MNKRLMAVLIVIVLLLVSCGEPELLVYTVIFDANGADGTPPESITVKERPYNYATSDYWDYISIPDKGNLNYPGKNFYGWNTDANGTGTRYSPSLSKYSPNLKVEKNMTLYAQWEELPYYAPTNLKYSFGDGIILTWDPIEGFTDLEDEYTTTINAGKIFCAYVVFRSYQSYEPGGGNYFSSGRGFLPWAYTSSPTYRDTRYDGIYGGDLDYFVAPCMIKVKAGSGDYVYGDFEIIVGPHSNVVSTYLIGSGTPLPAPTGLKATPYRPDYWSVGTLVSWDPVPNIFSVERYRLYYSYDNKNYYYATGSSSITSIIHDTIYIHYPGNGREEGRTVYYRVAPITAMVEDGFVSPPISIKLSSTPSAVTGLTATAISSKSIELLWDADSKSTGFEINCRIGSTGSFALVDTINHSSYIHTDLLPDTEYYYYVTGVNNEAPIVYPGTSSNTVQCKTLNTTGLAEPVGLLLTNKSSFPLKSIQINNGNNVLMSKLYRNNSFQIMLDAGMYTIKIINDENKIMIFPIEITNKMVGYLFTGTSWSTFKINLRNNYDFAISGAYLKRRVVDNWGNNLLLNNTLTTNNIKLLGDYEQEVYEILAESIQYYRVPSGANANGMIVSGGVLDGYQPVYYKTSGFSLNEDIIIIAPATGWVKIKPE